MVPGTGTTLFAEGNPTGTRDADTVVFRARLSSGGTGLVLANRFSSSAPTVIFQSGQDVAGRIVTAFGDPAISAGGHWVTFVARLADGGNAIVKARPFGGEAQLVAFDSAADPDSAYAELHPRPGVSDNGTVVFHARLAGGGRGLFTGRHPDTDTIAREGQALDGLGARAVTALPDAPLRESIDGQGMVVFEATLSDGTHAIVRAAPAGPVPDLIVAGMGPVFRPERIRTPLLYDGATGAFVKYFASACFVQDMVYGPDGKFYVLDIPSPSGAERCDTHDRVRRFDGATGQFDPVDDEFASYVPAGVYPGGFPNAFAFGPDGNLYVADGDENGRFPGTVFKFGGPLSAQPGAFLGVFVSPGAGGLSDPRRLRFGADRNLYVASFRTNQVLQYNGQTGAFMGVFAGPDTGLNGPVDLIFGPDGSMYVLSARDNSVRVYAGPRSPIAGTFLGTFIANLGIQAHSMAFGPADDLYVSGGNTRQTGVFRYDGGTGVPRGLFATVVSPIGPLLFSTRPAAHPELGDFDGNGCVDRQDLDLLTQQIGRPFPGLRFDLTGEGSVNVADARKLVLLFSRPQGAACE